jgi:glycosyltransferase involved in cell wall biosynthesis
MNNKGNSKRSKNRYAYIKPNNAVIDINRINSMRSDFLDGGPEAYVAQFLSVIGPEPSLIVSFANCPERALVFGNKEVFSLYWSYGASLKTLASRLSVCARLVRYLISFRPTKILCWQTNLPLWVTYFFSAISGAKFIVSRHTRFPETDDPWYRQLTGKIDKWVVRRASAIVCHGPYLRKETLAINVKSAKVLEFSWGFRHMFYDTEESTKVPDLTEGGTKRIILFLGRIFILKGVFDLLQACTGILRNRLNVKLVYIGDGPDLDKLKQEIEDTDLDNKVVTLGNVQHVLLRFYIRQSVVLVTPTKRRFPEGRCMATLEGLVMGVPVITPNFGPFPYNIEDGVNGLLFEPDSVQDLKEKILTILDDSDTYKTLKAGAKQSSTYLVNPNRGFSDAIKQAFELTEND